MPGMLKEKQPCLWPWESDKDLALAHITILDSLVVRISACHVEGPGSIPGRGVTLLIFFSLPTVNRVEKNKFLFNISPCQEAARVAQSVER